MSFAKFFPLIGALNLTGKVCLFVLAVVMRITLWAILKKTPAKDPVFSVAFHQRSRFIRFQVLDISALAADLQGATQVPPELKQ